MKAFAASTLRTGWWARARYNSIEYFISGPPGPLFVAIGGRGQPRPYGSGPGFREGTGLPVPQKTPQPPQAVPLPLRGEGLWHLSGDSRIARPGSAHTRAGQAPPLRRWAGVPVGDGLDRPVQVSFTRGRIVIRPYSAMRAIPAAVGAIHESPAKHIVLCRGYRHVGWLSRSEFFCSPFLARKGGAFHRLLNPPLFAIHSPGVAEFAL